MEGTIMAQVEICGVCGGNGYVKCPICNGKGKIKKDALPAPGTDFIMIGKVSVDCEDCNGTGKLLCNVCKGSGRLLNEKTESTGFQTFR
jgi:DnaJ-class molecular chaperone